MLMMITAEDKPSENWLAYASKCDMGSYELPSKRPLVGYFHINLHYMRDGMNGDRWFTWIETGIHEMMHALGFLRVSLAIFYLIKTHFQRIQQANTGIQVQMLFNMVNHILIVLAEKVYL